MKLPKLSRSGSNSSSPSSPLSYTPPASCASPLSPNSPGGSTKPKLKSFFTEKGKSLQLRLPSLPRSRSRSRSEIVAATSAEPSPKLMPSPLGRSNPETEIHAQPLTEHGSSSSGATIQERLKEEIKLVFEKFDSNGDGKISADELQCMLKALGDNTTRREAELMVAEADTDKDGFIDMEEFINLNMRGNVYAESSSEGGVVEELAAAFDMFDLDKNGCITPDELHHVLGNLGNRSSTLEDCKRMICGVDRKGCGYVDFDDFKIMMMTTNTSIMA